MRVLVLSRQLLRLCFKLAYRRLEIGRLEIVNGKSPISNLLFVASYLEYGCVVTHSDSLALSASLYLAINDSSCRATPDRSWAAFSAWRVEVMF